jgi:hypothetical protein
MTEAEARARWETWLTPQEALKALEILSESTAIRSILMALGARQLVACAETAVRIRYNNVEPPRPFMMVPALSLGRSEAAYDYADFWRTGSIEILEGSNESVRYFGVRFEPEGISKLLPAPPVRVSPVPPNPWTALAQYGYGAPDDAPVEPLATNVPRTSESSAPKKPISEATLKAWWAMCTTMKPSDQWDLPAMRSFFDRCFPDKSVSRDRLRNVRPSPKSGPKAKVAE